jgi:quinol-cytochrome oxidoreductase complex cytochrome b subunit
METTPSSDDQQQWRLTHLTETYKGLVTLAVEALKMLAIVNGAAAVAVLTYLGNLVSHPPSSGFRPPHIAPVVRWYCGGLFATLLAFVLAYAAQLILFNEEIKLREGSQIRRYHPFIIWLAVAFAVFAAIAFFLGSMRAAHILVGVRGA